MHWAIVDSALATAIGAAIVTALLLVLANRKLTKGVRDKLQFGSISLVAFVTIMRAITQSIPTHAWLRMAMLVSMLTAMWLVAWRSRRTDKDNFNSRVAVLAGYLAVLILQSPDSLLRH